MLASALMAGASAALASAHTIITYPGWRGNNFIENATFPYGMQWNYPCGGMRLSNNRTHWSTQGGAIAFQPGWFQGHQSAFIYVNMGFGTEGPDGGPKNMSNNMVPVFQILGPSNVPFPGTVCLPQVPLPKGVTVRPGDNATIQLVEIAQHGAALFSCVDITFAEPGDSRIADVNETNCYNDSIIGIADVYSLTIREPGQDPNSTARSGADARTRYLGQDRGAFMASLGWLPVILGGLLVLI